MVWIADCNNYEMSLYPFILVLVFFNYLFNLVGLNSKTLSYFFMSKKFLLLLVNYHPSTIRQLSPFFFFHFSNVNSIIVFNFIFLSSWSRTCTFRIRKGLNVSAQFDLFDFVGSFEVFLCLPWIHTLNDSLVQANDEHKAKFKINKIQ